MPLIYGIDYSSPLRPSSLNGHPLYLTIHQQSLRFDRCRTLHISWHSLSPHPARYKLIKEMAYVLLETTFWQVRRNSGLVPKCPLKVFIWRIACSVAFELCIWVMRWRYLIMIFWISFHFILLGDPETKMQKTKWNFITVYSLSP